MSEQLPKAEYPRPQWKREKWYSLNGTWEFAFDFGNSGHERGMVEGGDYPYEITVPFCPESKLSGIGYTDFILAAWYRRKEVLHLNADERVLLHFGAVDYECSAYVNGIKVGDHIGGYSSFSFDITDALCEGENTFVVAIRDNMVFCRDAMRDFGQPFGKQSHVYDSAGVSYTRTTGIWQSVWLEFVPKKYMVRSKMIPNAVQGNLAIQLTGKNTCTGDKAKLCAYYDGKLVGETECAFAGEFASALLEVSEKHLWNPGDPQLYDLTVALIDGKSGKTVDCVESYFALRDVALTPRCLTINGKPVFMRLVLDQGFNPDGICTYPSDDAIRRDIELSMDLGFNGARLHERVFEERTLYWADKLGYIVWGESEANPHTPSTHGLKHIIPSWMETLQRDFNHPAIIGWCPFNETNHYEKLDPLAHMTVYRLTKLFDPSRPVIDASGGVHYETDMFDVHEYEHEPDAFHSYFEDMREDGTPIYWNHQRYCAPGTPLHESRYKGQPYWISEYGGIRWNPNSELGDKAVAYGTTPKDEEEFASRYERLTAVLLDHPRICGFCYTQLTDVEQEQNGLYAYDRTRKLSDWVYDRIRAVNTKIAAIEKIVDEA